MLTALLALVPQAVPQDPPAQPPAPTPIGETQPNAGNAPLQSLQDEMAGLLRGVRELREQVGGEPAAPLGEIGPDGEVLPDKSELAPNDKRWRLFSQGAKGFKITGWVSQGANYNFTQPRDDSNGPVTWNDRANDYQLNEVYTTIENAALCGNDEWGVGARVDLLYGTNSRFVTSAGLESTWNSGNEYGLAMPNAYVEVKTGRIKTKLGHFMSPVGFYAIGTANNFFNVLPYTFQYGEPFTHTGALSTMQVRDDLTVGVGITGGWDSTANWSSQSSPIGVKNAWNRHVGALVTVTKNEVGTKGDSLAYVGVWSQEPDVSLAGRDSRYLQTLVYTLPLADNVTWVVQSDLGYQNNARTDKGSGRNDAWWYGLNQYVTWTIDSQWSLGANFEWFRDEDGFRVGSPLPSLGTPNSTSFGRGLFQGNFFRAMVGPQWSPHSNLMVRPAVVYDCYQGPGAAGGVKPFDSGTSKDQLMVMLDLVVFF